MNQAIEEYVKDWLKKVSEDIIVVEKLTKDEVVATSAVCFHCQQVAEKVLKAYLIANGKEIRKTHNLEFLISECSDFDPEFDNIELKNLSDFGVEICYPGDLYIPNKEETLEYKKLAFEVKIFTEIRINRLFKQK